MKRLYRGWKHRKLIADLRQTARWSSRLAEGALWASQPTLALQYYKRSEDALTDVEHVLNGDLGLVSKDATKVHVQAGSFIDPRTS